MLYTSSPLQDWRVLLPISDVTMHHPHISPSDDYLFGWDPTPGIVSVWADHDGHALVWQRDGATISWVRERFRPWLFATTLADVAHLGAALVPENAADREHATVTYRNLDGPSDGYRYLLSAQSGRALERAIRNGAESGLGRPLRALGDLEQYYRVGPVEQYLMQSGRVYFRGLAYADLHRLQFDLETTALNPRDGYIFLVAVRDSWGFEAILEAASPEEEPRLIANLCTLIRERDPDVVENHNLFGFDLPFLAARASLLGVPLELGRYPGPLALKRYEEGPSGAKRRRARYSIAGRELIDTLDAVRRHDFVVRDLPSHGLKEVARAFGVASPNRVYIPGAEVYSTYQRDPELVRHYALDDVTEVDRLSQRLLGAAFALTGMAPRSYERVASAGPAMGILEPMLVRAYLRRSVALPPPLSARPSREGSHAGGAAYLFASGIAEQVVKADVASLYPSLMRLYGIGPACDRLGVLLSIVSRLTELRLQHKAAARAAATQSMEEVYHAAMQAAMKLIINSAYGYMGADQMALFADPAAADEVTRRGREMLERVVEALRGKGMALIEADTDGVYFAVPGGWTETQERALVAAVAATLPEGLQLEYEGRYRAMFSHEVKNYALLTYSGELIVRGVALRSSRAERFGEKFLHEALRCTMMGDAVGVRQAFLTTIAALRDGSLPLSEITTRVRLSKSPEAYLRARASRREFAYEALLAAGRTNWRVGERVRCYRGTHGEPIWVPDKSSEPTSEMLASTGNYDIEHYLRVLVTSYASRLRKAYAPADFEQLFRLDAQLGLFDRPFKEIEPLRIRCPKP